MPIEQIQQLGENIKIEKDNVNDINYNTAEEICLGISDEELDNNSEKIRSYK